jgi:hypothetical protein
VNVLPAQVESLHWTAVGPCMAGMVVMHIVLSHGAWQVMPEQT